MTAAAAHFRIRPERDSPRSCGALAWAVLCAYAYSVATGPLTHGFSAYYAAARALATGRLGAWVYDDALFTGYVQDIRGTAVLDIFGPNTPSMSLLLGPLA